MKESDRSRSRERLVRIAEATLDSTSVRYEVVAELKRVIGFERWAWPLADPQTHIPLAGIAEHDYGRAIPRLLELEYQAEDFAGMTTLARRSSPAASLQIETGGDPARSRRWDEVLRAVGISDETAVACRDHLGCWGWLKAYRDSEERPFAPLEVEFLAQVAPILGAALRRSLTKDRSQDSIAPDQTGLVILDSELTVVAETAAAGVWIDSLPAAHMYAAYRMLPAMVYPVATRARAGSDPSLSRALERARDGGWVVVEAARLSPEGKARIAVTFRRAAPEETFDRLCLLYALTPRERTVVACLLGGADSASASADLAISPYTLQDHLKSVFAKIGIHSRRELFAHFGQHESPA